MRKKWKRLQFLDEGENLRFLSIKKTERLKMSNEKEYFEKNFVANCLYEG